MKKHYLNIFITLLLSVFVLLAHLVFKTSLLFLLPILFSHIFIVLYGVLNLDFNYFFKTICEGKTIQKQIAITFDDGPVEQSKVLLQLLKETSTPATFFCIGKNVKQNPAILKQIFNDGHIIANHSYSHAHLFDFFSSAKVLKELKDCNQAIEAVINKQPLFFRPPNGVSNPMIAKALNQTKLKSIGWNIRTFDTSIKNTEAIFTKLGKKIKPGAIILMHDTMPNTVTLVSKLIVYCKENNYEIVALDHLLNLKAYE